MDAKRRPSLIESTVFGESELINQQCEGHPGYCYLLTVRWSVRCFSIAVHFLCFFFALYLYPRLLRLILPVLLMNLQYTAVWCVKTAIVRKSLYCNTMIFFISNALYQTCMTHDHNDHSRIKCFQNAGKKCFCLSAEYTFCLVGA